MLWLRDESWGERLDWYLWKKYTSGAYWCICGLILLVMLIVLFLWCPFVDWILSEPVEEFPLNLN